MKILVTGANGFIGRAFARMARSRGHQVIPLQRQPDGAALVGTLEAPPWDAITAAEPDAVLHLAWTAVPGVYLTSPENDVLLAASRQFLDKCGEIGIHHIAAAGTCIEYAASTLPLAELTSPLAPGFPYSQAKVLLFQWLQERFQADDWTWFRIFYPYGPGEHPKRLPSMIATQLALGEKVELRTPDSIKDYIYVDDLASGICHALEQRLAGPVNLGTGTGVKIEHLARLIARLLNAEPSSVAHAPTLSNDPWPVQIADASRLRSTGWVPTTSLEEGCTRLISSLSLR